MKATVDLRQPAAEEKALRRGLEQKLAGFVEKSAELYGKA